MSNVNSNNFRTVEEVERDRESAEDWWDSRYDDELPDVVNPALDLHPCPVVSNGSCAKPSCVGCKMPKALNKRREEWEIK